MVGQRFIAAAFQAASNESAGYEMPAWLGRWRFRFSKNWVLRIRWPGNSRAAKGIDSFLPPQGKLQLPLWRLSDVALYGPGIIEGPLEVCGLPHRAPNGLHLGERATLFNFTSNIPNCRWTQCDPASCCGADKYSSRFREMNGFLPVRWL